MEETKMEESDSQKSDPSPGEDLARIAEIDAFLIEHSVKVNRKKKKLLAGLPVGPYETYKLGVIVANCCKVFG
jgi:hypothetical protein